MSMNSDIFHEGLNKALGVSNKTFKDIKNVFDNVFTGGKVSYQKENPIDAPDTFNKDKLLQAIRYNETRGEKDPYSYYRSSGSKVLGRALGAYQVTEGELKTYGKKFLGKDIAADDFLKNPTAQDNYMQAKINHGMNDLKLNPAEILATHRGGYTNPDKAMVKYKTYVDSGMKAYNNLQ